MSLAHATPSTDHVGLESALDTVGHPLDEEDRKDGSGGTPGANNGVNAGAVKANKGMILRKSVEYIRCVAWVG